MTILWLELQFFMQKIRPDNKFFNREQETGVKPLKFANRSWGSGLVSCILSHCYVIKQHGKASQDRIIKVKGVFLLCNYLFLHALKNFLTFGNLSVVRQEKKEKRSALDKGHILVSRVLSQVLRKGIRMWHGVRS